MSVAGAFGIVGAVASVIGVVLAIRYARATATKSKRLCYTRSLERRPMFATGSLERYGISVSYEKDGTEERIHDLFVHYLLFANLGREPILRQDLVSSNPLRIRVVAPRVLDVSVEAVNRDVSDIEVGELEHVAGHEWVAPVTFDFLDYRDGAAVRVLSTDAKPRQVSLVGDVVGMPRGIEVEAPTSRRGVPGTSSITAAMVLIAVSLAVSVLAFRWITGSWENVALLGLPLVALFLPAGLVAFVARKMWPSPRRLFPSRLLEVVGGRMFEGPRGPVFTEHNRRNADGVWTYM